MKCGGEDEHWNPPCGGTPTPPSCPAPLVNLTPSNTCPISHPSKCAISEGEHCDDDIPCCDYNIGGEFTDFECEGGTCVKTN